MVVTIGSMAIKGVFKAGALLSGLGSTIGKLKKVQMNGKSTNTEMKRMTKTSHMLRNALAAIGITGFTALLMQTPQLSGALAKIKTDMQLIAWSIGKHLKPSLEAVSDILHGIRTGDWSVIKQGVVDLAFSLADLALKAGSFVVDVIFGEGAAESAKKDFNTWMDSLKTAWEEGDLGGLIKALLWDPSVWVLKNAYEWGKTNLGPTFKNILQGAYDEGFNFMNELKQGRTGEAFRGLPIIGKMMQFAGYDRAYQQYQENLFKVRGEQVGGIIPSTGLYNMHAGETVTPAGASSMSGESGSSNIIVDFTGANINLANGVELDEFANAISLKIAERQGSRIY